MKHLHACFAVAIAVALILAIVTDTSAGEPTTARAGKTADGWVPVFDGKTLAGWTVKCRPKDKDKKYWKVDKGAIAADVPPGSKHHYIWLLTKKEYADFELKLKVQTFRGTRGNSGIQVRSRYDDKAGWLDGPQVDIHPPGPWRNGFIYDETRGAQVWISPIVGKPSKARPSDAVKGWTWRHAGDNDAWNDVHITCRGTRIKVVINGVKVTDYDGKGRLDDEHHKRRNVGLKGHVAFQIHPGGGLRIRFKDIFVKPLKAAGKPDKPVAPSKKA